MKADQIKQRAKEKEGKLRSIEIEDWKCKVFFKPLTVADQQHITQKFKGLVQDNLGFAIEIIHLKCLDEEGKRIWSDEDDRNFLRTEVDQKIIQRLMLAITGTSLEDSKKNS